MPCATLFGFFLFCPFNIVNATSSTYHTYSQSKFKRGKAVLDKSGKKYDTKTQRITKKIYYIYWGPFAHKNNLILAIKKLKNYDVKYKLISKNRYLFIGAYPDLKTVNQIKKILDPKEVISFKIIEKQKTITRYSIIINNTPSNTKDNEVIVLSSPPPQIDVPSSTPSSIPKDNLKGDLIISTLYFSETTDNLIRAFAQPTYSLHTKSETWKGHLGLSVDLSFSNMEIFENNIFEPHKTYFSYNKDNISLTLGHQVLSWGRVFENSILDRFNRQNLHAEPQLNLSEKSLSQLALRFKYYLESSNSSIDFIYIPIFRPSSLPEEGKAWSPINTRSLRILGVPPNPIVEQLIEKGSFGQEDLNKSAYGSRFETNIFNIESGFTIIQSPQLLPYYKINQQTIEYISSGLTVSQAIASSQGKTFMKQYPNQSLIAFDLSKEFAGTIYRFEIGHNTNRPVTSIDFDYKLMDALVWNLSIENYPRSGKDTLNIMLSGEQINTNKNEVLDHISKQYLATRYLIKFYQDNIEFEFKANIGLHESDLQILPEISYIPIDNHLLTLGIGYFKGDEKSIGGFYEDSNHITLQWKYSY